MMGLVPLKTEEDTTTHSMRGHSQGGWLQAGNWSSPGTALAHTLIWDVLPLLTSVLKLHALPHLAAAGANAVPSALLPIPFLEGSFTVSCSLAPGQRPVSAQISLDQRGRPWPPNTQ